MTIRTLAVACSLAYLLLFIPQVFAEKPEPVPMVQGRVVLGYVEHIVVGDGLELETLLSPAHHNSELGVEKLKISSVGDGKRIAKFSLRGKKGETQQFSLKVLEKKEGSKSKDVVVRLPICLGKYELTPHFRLVDRSQYGEKARLGRRVLAGRVVVDPSTTHAALPDCKKMKKKTASEKK